MKNIKVTNQSNNDTLISIVSHYKYNKLNTEYSYVLYIWGNEKYKSRVFKGEIGSRKMNEDIYKQSIKLLNQIIKGNKF